MSRIDSGGGRGSQSDVRRKSEKKEKHETITVEKMKEVDQETREREEIEYDEDDEEIESGDHGRREKIEHVTRIIRGYFSETGFTETDIANLIEESYQACDHIVGEEAAVEWSKDSNGVPFTLTDEISKGDEEDLRRVGGDLTKLVEMKQERLANDRFSAARIRECVPVEYPEYDILMDIAQGVELVVREDFKPSAHPRGPLRQSYKRVASAVNKTLAKAHDDGLNIMLPSVQVFGKPGVNVIHQHWAPNFPRPEGRAVAERLCEVQKYETRRSGEFKRREREDENKTGRINFSNCFRLVDNGIAAGCQSRVD